MSRVRLPSGFSTLVERVLAEDAACDRTLPSDVEGIWDSFTYYVFMDENRSDAEVNYLYNIFKDHELLDLGAVSRLRDDWCDCAREIVEQEMARCRQGRKRGTLMMFVRDESLWRTTRCIIESADYFYQRAITPQMVERRTSTSTETAELIAEIAYFNSPYHVYNIGLTKTILWLHSFGLGLDHCPPSRQSRSFVTEDLEAQRGPPQPIEWSDYWPWLDNIRRVADHLSVTVRDVAKAIWYYKTCQSLLAKFRLRSRLNPGNLLEFVDQNGWQLSDLTDVLCDIDGIDELAMTLREFILSI